MRGRLPKPTDVRRLEGNPGHRTLPKREPKYSRGLPDKPRMSPAAKKVWDELVDEMAASSVLRRVDRRALWQLSEDEAILAAIYDGLWKMAARLKQQAEAEGKDLPAGAMMSMLTMKTGRLAMASLRDLAARVIIERREFGLTPSSRSRIEVDAEASGIDSIELKLCG